MLTEARTHVLKV